MLLSGWRTRQRCRLGCSRRAACSARSPCGAEGETRTPTGSRPLRPERSASANSATSARAIRSPLKHTGALDRVSRQGRARPVAVRRRDPEEPGGVPREDRAHLRLGAAELPARLELLLQIARREPAGKPARVRPEDDPPRADRVQILPEQPAYREIVR